MRRMNRRSALKLGGLAAAGMLGSIALPAQSNADSYLLEDGEVPPEWKESDTEAVRKKPRAPQPIEPSPSSTLYRALDTDFGVFGVQPQSWFDSARANGYEGFITTLHTYWGGDPQPWLSSHVALERALAAGMWIGAYGRPVSKWREALTHLPLSTRAKLKFFALDIEPEPGGTQPVMKQEYADGVASLGVRPVIYTGWGMWGDVMGYSNSQFPHIPLWDFSGDRTDWPEAITEPELVEFGGWNSPNNLRVGWQVQMQTPAVVGGVYVDRDVFSRAFIDVT